MISGKEQPDSGSIELGETLKLVSVEQMRDALDDSKTVWEAVSDGLDVLRIGSYEILAGLYWPFNSRAVTSRSAWVSCPGVNAVDCNWPAR